MNRARPMLMAGAAILLALAGLYLGGATGADPGQPVADSPRPPNATSPARTPVQDAAATAQGGLPAPDAIRSDPALAREYVAAAEFCLDNLVDWAIANPGLETPRVDAFGGAHSCEKLLHTYRGKHRTMLEQMKRSADPQISGMALTLQYQDIVSSLPGGGDLPVPPSGPEMEMVRSHLKEVEAHSNPCDLPSLMRLALAQRLAGKGPFGNRELLLVYEASNLLFPGDELVQAGVQLAAEGLSGSDVTAVRQAASNVAGNCKPGGLLNDLEKLRG